MNTASPWVCPHCQQPLSRQSAVLACGGGHSFDVAREGYVNLLVGRQKAGDKGDSGAMLIARRQFFDGGHYEPLCRRVAAVVKAGSHDVIADIGCGEGYYLGTMAEHIFDAVMLGTDISKDGVRRAAKRYPRVHWAVADTNQAIPLAGRSVDVVLNIFAPRNGAEFARVLKPGGRVVVVVPTANHLAELRRQGWLIGIQPDKRQAVQRSLAPGLRLVAAETLTVPLKLRGAQLTSLVAMTPSARHSTPQQLAQLADNGPVAVTAEFELLTFALSEALAV